MKFRENGPENSEVKKCKIGWGRSAVEIGRGYTYSWLIHSTVQSIQMSVLPSLSIQNPNKQAAYRICATHFPAI
jgi:hypothetical protein